MLFNERVYLIGFEERGVIPMYYHILSQSVNFINMKG